MKMQMFDLFEGDNEFILTAYLDKNGCLSLEGEDSYDASQSMFGSSELEYSYSFNKENTEKLANLFPDNELLNALKEILTSPKMLVCDFLDLCHKEEIEYSYSSLG